MARTVEQIKADIAAADAVYKAASAVAAKQSFIDAVANEGGEGYSYGDEQKSLAFDVYIAALKPLRAELFASLWTPEVTAARRAAWNAEMAPYLAAKKNPTTPQFLAVQDKLGFTFSDLKEALGK